MATKTQKKRYNGEGCITQQKDGRWVARIQIGKKEDGKQKIKALYGHSEREVRKKLKEFQKEMATGIQEVSKLTVSEYIERWLKVYKFNSVKAGTYDRMENTFKYHIQDTIGYIQMGNIKTLDIQLLINEKSEKLSYSSVKKIQELLNPCFKHAVIVGDIIRNPMLGVTMPVRKNMNVKAKEIKIYSDEDIERIFKTINDNFTDTRKLYRYSPIFILMFNTGLRAGEILALKWSDVDLEKRTFKVVGNMGYVKNRDSESDKKREIVFTDPKTVNSIRYVPLNSKSLWALNEIERRNKIQIIESEYVVSDVNGKYVLPRNFSRTFETLCKRAEVEFLGCHATRHTFASNAIRRGINIKVVSEILGHSNIQITFNRYVHVIQEQKMQAVDLLDAI